MLSYAAVKKNSLAVFALVVSQAIACMAWDASTPQPNKYELPPASPEVVREAKAAKARLKTVLPSMIIAHRGESEYCPENTVPAFAAAVAGGFGFECDLWLSNDGVIFITHDARLGAKKGHAAHGWATNMVWRGSLEKSDVGSWKAPEWTGTRMPTIDDVLPWAGDGHEIELHVCDSRANLILPKLKEALLRHSNATPKNVRINISWRGRGWLRGNLPEYRCTSNGLLRNGWRVTDKPLDIKSIVNDIGPDGQIGVWSPRWDEDLLTSEIVELAHYKGVRVCVWTVNDAASAWAALGRGVDFIMTDRPSSLLREMKEF
jgi:glycerophosphoryl diester phosphodiesterase